MNGGNLIKKSLLIFIIFIVVISVFFAGYQYMIDSSEEINVKRAAVSFLVDDPSSIKSTSIFIQGKIHKPFFKEHYFKGSIIIDGYDFTTKNDLVDLYASKTRQGVSFGSIMYQSKEKPYRITNLGLIYYDSDFKTISIEWKKTPEDFDKHYLNTVTADNYDQAVDLLEKMRRQVTK